MPAPTLDSLLSQSLRCMDRPTECCCGRVRCAYLEYNNAALEGLERDLQNAAQIGQVSSFSLPTPVGFNPLFRVCRLIATVIRLAAMPLTFALQALLSRHEAYMAEAEDERKKIGASIDRLEEEKKELQAINTKTIEENRYLLDQLEEMNHTVSDSDAHIASLNNTLKSTRKELERLTVLAAQTSHLEAQLAKYEKEQAEIRSQLGSKEEQERTAVQRWRGAERIISTLQEQVDRIEREAREERARHAEVVARFERRRAVERELEHAAGRLKGAAAATSLGKNGSVVSHFVKDILSDNANLQLGIVELREMLMGSNEEVNSLREQMLLHQPIPERLDNPEGRSSLGNELANVATNDTAPDFHVHHHYHVTPKLEAKDRIPSIRRPKRRRNITSQGFGTPSSGSQTPCAMPPSPYIQATPSSSAAAILSQTSVTIPPPSNPSYTKQWAMPSSQPPISVAASSSPSSTQSAFRSLSLFDTIDDVLDLSRPSTPGSTTLGVPDSEPRHSKQGSDDSVRSLSTNAGSNAPKSIFGVLQAAETDVNESVDSEVMPLSEHKTILEESEEEATSRPPITQSGLNDYLQDHFTSMQPAPSRLHRANSHESILSTRNTDVPKVRRKGSQFLKGQGFTPRTSLGTATIAVGPVTSSTAAVGRPSNSRQGYDSSNYNRILLGTSPSSATTSEFSTAGKSTLGKRVGGWVLGKWGVPPQPTVSTGDLRAKTLLSAVDGRVKNDKGVDNRLSTHIEPAVLDNRLLQESLGETLKGQSFGV